MCRPHKKSETAAHPLWPRAPLLSHGPACYASCSACTAGPMQLMHESAPPNTHLEDIVFRLTLNFAAASVLAASAFVAQSAQAHINMIGALQSRKGDQK